ncbi:MAG: winged helix-turn-helix transcriptional regulator [Theionarchaea archaeon]|nr:winged helix-turn-helix transcriptional regulator [Theionarchaea archaeon]
MDMNISRKEREVLKLPGLTGTWEILTYLCEHDTGSYRHFRTYISDSTLNKRLRQLLRSGLIEHHLTREDSKKEWYEITERGKKFTKLMTAQLKLFKSFE